jgi:hypothetical protein
MTLDQMNVRSSRPPMIDRSYLSVHQLIQHRDQGGRHAEGRILPRVPRVHRRRRWIRVPELQGLFGSDDNWTNETTSKQCD